MNRASSTRRTACPIPNLAIAHLVVWGGTIWRRLREGNRYGAALLRGIHSGVAIGPVRGLIGNQFVGEIARDALCIALLGRTDAAAARRMHHQPIAGRDELKTLAAEFLAGLQAHVAGGAVV